MTTTTTTAATRTMTGPRLRLGSALLAGLALLAVLLGCSSPPSPEREVERFFTRFNDQIPEVISQQRSQLLEQRTALSRTERAARQRGDDERAREVALELDRLESEIRFLEQLDPKMLHLDFRVVDVEELEWPDGARRVTVNVEGYTLQVQDERLDLSEIREEHREWVFTLTHDETSERWTILDQRLSGMQPFDEELRRRVEPDAEERQPPLTEAEQVNRLMQHAVHRLLAAFGRRFSSPFEESDPALLDH